MTTLYQLELDQNVVNCGSSHVIQLESGHFIILDGGYFTPGEDERLFTFLTNRSEGTPTIKAWYFSHAHQDHVGNFIQFIRKYGDNVQIERMLYSFHPVDFSDIDGDWKSSDPATIQAFYETVETHCASIEQVTLQTGDSFTFEELTLDVLYTYEDIYPERARFNDYSTVMVTTVGGHRTLWLGDAYIKTADILLKRPEQLKCDIVQVAHHAIDNHERLCDLYAATEASVALWPTPDYGIAMFKDHEVNQFLLHGMGIAEHFVGGYGTAALPLPYRPGLATKEKKANSLDRQPDPAVEFDNAETPSNAFRYLTPEGVEPSLS